MSFDDELRKFEDLTRDIELSPEAKRNAKKLANAKAPTPARPAAPVKRPAAKGSIFARMVQWAERRAVTQSRAWGR